MNKEEIIIQSEGIIGRMDKDKDNEQLRLEICNIVKKQITEKKINMANKRNKKLTHL